MVKRKVMAYPITSASGIVYASITIIGPYQTRKEQDQLNKEIDTSLSILTSKIGEMQLEQHNLYQQIDNDDIVIGVS